MTKKNILFISAGVGMLALAAYLEWKNKQPKKTASFVAGSDGKCKKACLDLLHMCVSNGGSNCQETYQNCVASCDSNA